MNQHPIYFTPYDKAFPWLCCCAKSKKDKSDTYSKMEESKVTASGIDKKIEKLNQEKADLRKKKEEEFLKLGDTDPVNGLGIGFMNFKKTLFMLAMMFTVLSVITIPLVISYSNGKGMGSH